MRPSSPPPCDEEAADARVTALGQKLDFVKDHFEKRVLFDKDMLPAELDVEISALEILEGAMIIKGERQ